MELLKSLTYTCDWERKRVRNIVIKTKKAIFILGFLFSTSFSLRILADEVVLKSTLSVTGIIVSSSCVFEVTNEGAKSHVIDFGNYNQASGQGTLQRNFIIEGRESGSEELGCSALLAGNELVEIKFGDESTNQLDEVGVITQGAGGGIRIQINALDNEATNRKAITKSNSSVYYEKKFAQQARFSFSALARGLDEAEPGSYSGRLSVSIIYK